MTTVTNVSNITKVDGTTDELRGYEKVQIEDGFIMWAWMGTSPTVVVIPMHQIKELVATEEHSE